MNSRSSAWKPLAPAVIGLAVPLAIIDVAVYGWLLSTIRLLHYNDFGKFYYAVISWRDHGSLYSANPATYIPFTESTGRQFWNMNPPHFHLLIWPLVSLPPETAFWCWTALNILAGAFAVLLCARETNLRLTPVQWFAVIVVGFWAAPTLAWAGTGQLTGLLMLLVTWVWVDMRAGKWRPAGVAAGIAWSAKLLFAPLGLYLVCKRRWWAGVLAAFVGGAWFVVGAVIFGWRAYEEWLYALEKVNWSWAVMNGSIYGPIARAWLTPDVSVGLTPDLTTARHLGLLLSVLVLAVGFIVAATDDDPDRGFALLVLTCLLASPLGWVYYFWVALGPMLALRQRSAIRTGCYLAAPGLLLPYFLLFPFPSRLFAVTLGSAYTWSLLALWGGTLVDRLRRHA